MGISWCWSWGQSALTCGGMKFTRLQDTELTVEEAGAGQGAGPRRGWARLPWARLGAAGALFCLLLIVSLNKRDLNTKHAALVAGLNHSAAVQGQYRAELQRLGARLNIVWANLSRLDTAQAQFRRSKPWLLDLNDAKRDLEDKVRGVITRLDATDTKVAELRDKVKELRAKEAGRAGAEQEAGARLSRAEQELARLREEVRARLGGVANTTRDISLDHSELRDNVYQVTRH